MISASVFPGTMTFRGSYSFFSLIFLSEIRCPSNATIFSSFPLISHSSPVIAFFEEVSATEKIVCRIASFKSNSEIVTWFFRSISGIQVYSSADFTERLYFVFLQRTVAWSFSPVSSTTSPSGSFLTISPNTFAWIAILPSSSMFPGITVSIPNSRLFPVRVISSFSARSKRHSKIEVVAFAGTAFDTVWTAFAKSVFLQIIFIK